mgnify:CR=1 FL=1|tara:strand:- start:14343 stop:15932 length:1590 start_codon:yes stop_codon:yes gene_type:complete
MKLPLYTAAQVREMDAQVIASGIGGFELMQRAGAAAFQLLGRLWPPVRHVVVLCGPGNNGGDGYVIADLARRGGWHVEVLQLGDHARLSGSALQAARMARDGGLYPRTWSAEVFLSVCDGARTEVVIVDAMLGSGARAPLTDEFAAAVDQINRAGLPVLAIDLPTGVNADTGAVETTAVRATATISFIGRKQGLYTGAAPDYAGRLCFDSLMIPKSVLQQHPAINPSAYAIDVSLAMQLLPPRRRDAHKGNHGRAVIVGGDLGFGGAALMAAESAARSGAGTVALITRSAHVMPALARQPEIMVHGIDDWGGKQSDSARSLLSSASVIVIGPGLGASAWSAAVLSEVLMVAVQTGIPLVLDADALNLLSRQRNVWHELAPQEQRKHWILTPHPGEVSRLLNCSAAIVRADRFAAVRRLQALTGATCLIKGAGTILALSPDSDGVPVPLEVCAEGNPGMASGGMGDVLAGLLGGLVAQGVSPTDAVRIGVCVHGEAADQLAPACGERGMLATDLLPVIRRLLNNIWLNQE